MVVVWTTQEAKSTINDRLDKDDGEGNGPPPVFLPGESQGQRSLVGCCLWGHTGSDTTEAT